MKETAEIESNIGMADIGDEIHFKFQSTLKKFSFSFVRSIIPTRY